MFITQVLVSKSHQKLQAALLNISIGRMCHKIQKLTFNGPFGLVKADQAHSIFTHRLISALAETMIEGC